MATSMQYADCTANIELFYPKEPHREIYDGSPPDNVAWHNTPCAQVVKEFEVYDRSFARSRNKIEAEIWRVTVALEMKQPNGDTAKHSFSANRPSKAANKIKEFASQCQQNS